MTDRLRSYAHTLADEVRRERCAMVCLQIMEQPEKAIRARRRMAKAAAKLAMVRAEMEH